MHTFGAVLLATIGMVLMQVLLGFLSVLLGGAIIESTGIVWLPASIIVALTGCAVYAGVYFGLRVARLGNTRITFGVVAAILLFSGGRGVLSAASEESHRTLFIAMSILGIVAGLIGGWLAKAQIDEERDTEEPAADHAP